MATAKTEIKLQLVQIDTAYGLCGKKTSSLVQLCQQHVFPLPPRCNPSSKPALGSVLSMKHRLSTLNSRAAAFPGFLFM